MVLLMLLITSFLFSEYRQRVVEVAFFFGSVGRGAESAGSDVVPKKRTLSRTTSKVIAMYLMMNCWHFLLEC